MSIEARKTRRGKTRYLARVRSGTQLVASRTFDRKSDAEAWEREQKHLLDTGRPLPPKRKFTMQELVERFLAAREGGNPHTVDTDRNNLAALPATLLKRSLATVQAGDIREHLLAELRSGKAPATVARAKTTLSALFTYADEQGYLHQPHPVRTMKKIPELSTVAQRAVSPNEIPSPRRVAGVLAALRQRRSDIADVFEFMSLTGVRWGELRAIRVNWLSEVPLAQLNVERSHSDRYEEKNPKSWRGTRPVPLSPRALAIFRQYAVGKAARRLPVHQPAGRAALGRRRPQVPPRLPPPRAPPLRGVHLAAARHARARGRGLPGRRSTHRPRGLRARPRGRPTPRPRAASRRRRGVRPEVGTLAGHSARSKPRTLTSTPPGDRRNLF
ncbi:hypothetical protein [Microbacterium aurum]